MLTVDQIFELAETHGAIFIWNSEDDDGLRSIDFDRLIPHIATGEEKAIRYHLAHGNLWKLPVIARPFLARR